jgi:hypothetical protein
MVVAEQAPPACGGGRCLDLASDILMFLLHFISTPHRPFYIK